MIDHSCLSDLVGTKNNIVTSLVNILLQRNPFNVVPVRCSRNRSTVYLKIRYLKDDFLNKPEPKNFDLKHLNKFENV